VSPPLFLLDDIPDTPELFLSGDEGRHAARVQRIRAGETIRVADGAGTVLTCRVRSVVADGLHLTVVDRRHVPPPDPRIVVVQALAKGERSELAVEMLTELGADELLPWAASRSVVQWHGARGEKALERWRRTARAAAKQSRRARVPDIADLHSTADVVARLGGAAGLVLHEDAARPLASAPLPERGHIVVVVGPEGGVAPDELDAFEAAGAACVRLGEPVLRTSTAGAAALAVLSARLDRWR
jgi:16S rRNA (uracil1498-N3)-methyltransferase